MVRKSTSTASKAVATTERRVATAAPAKAVAKKAVAKAVVKAAPAKTTPAKETAKKAAPTPAKATTTKAQTMKVTAKRPTARTAAPTKPAARRAPAPATSGGYVGDTKFLEHQREALLRERATYLEQASSLQAEAQSLVEEMEPGDIQFDDESGEGGTVTVDRERDLALSAQALAAVEEIDDALAKIKSGRYGICEGCGELIPKARLEALPYARLCISCKAGGLSRR
jgi:RNA polymerase-binding transcription factor DksA